MVGCFQARSEGMVSDVTGAVAYDLPAPRLHQHHTLDPHASCFCFVRTCTTPCLHSSARAGGSRPKPAARCGISNGAGGAMKEGGLCLFLFSSPACQVVLHQPSFTASDGMAQTHSVSHMCVPCPAADAGVVINNTQEKLQHQQGGTEELQLQKLQVPQAVSDARAADHMSAEAPAHVSQHGRMNSTMQPNPATNRPSD